MSAFADQCIIEYFDPKVKEKITKNGKIPLQTQRHFSRKGSKKKRGRKEDLRRERKRLTASATFLAFKIPFEFEHEITEMKTKKDEFVNGENSFHPNVRAEKFKFQFIVLKKEVSF